MPLILWRYHGGAKSFAEAVPMSETMDDRVLVASYRPQFRPRIQADFATWDPVGEVGVDLGHRGNGCPLSRDLRLYLVSDFEPLARTQDWVVAFEGQEIDAPEPCPKPEE